MTWLIVLIIQYLKVSVAYGAFVFFGLRVPDKRGSNGVVSILLRVQFRTGNLVQRGFVWL